MGYVVLWIHFLLLISPATGHAFFCKSILNTTLTTRIAHIPHYNDPRVKLERLYQRQFIDTLKIGEGNSAFVYLVRRGNGQFVVVKVYREHRSEALERDHLGLLRIKDMFNLDKNHSINLKVVDSEIHTGFSTDPYKKVLVMPYVPGINLHDLLINTPHDHPLVQRAISLYTNLIQELDATSHTLGFRDEIRPESHLYFQDHKVDGLMTLKIGSRPSLLIKTDNIIFNPEDNTLTLVDPY